MAADKIHHVQPAWRWLPTAFKLDAIAINAIEVALQIDQNTDHTELSDIFMPTKIEAAVHHYLSEVWHREPLADWRAKIDRLQDAIAAFDASVPRSSEDTVFRYARSTYCFDESDAERAAHQAAPEREAEWRDHLSPERVHKTLAIWSALLSHIRSAATSGGRTMDQAGADMVGALAEIWKERSLSFNTTKTDVGLRGPFVDFVVAVEEAIKGFRFKKENAADNDPGQTFDEVLAQHSMPPRASLATDHRINQAIAQNLSGQ